jgi:hypothetical protein
MSDFYVLCRPKIAVREHAVRRKSSHVERKSSDVQLGAENRVQRDGTELGAKR